MKAKAFEGSSVKELEDEVNEWLETAGGIEIVHMAQSATKTLSTYSHVLTLLYTTKVGYTQEHY